MTVDTQTEISFIEELAVVPFEDNDDPNLRTHIVNPPMNMPIFLVLGNLASSQDIVDHARLHGLEVTALCGYVFVPKHNPEKYDACDGCMKIAGDIMRSMGE